MGLPKFWGMPLTAPPTNATAVGEDLGN